MCESPCVSSGEGGLQGPRVKPPGPSHSRTATDFGSSACVALGRWHSELGALEGGDWSRVQCVSLRSIIRHLGNWGSSLGAVLPRKHLWCFFLCCLLGQDRWQWSLESS